MKRKGLRIAIVFSIAVTLLGTACASTKTGEIIANGLSFAYVDRGSGPAVVLVHGSVSDLRGWSGQMAPLAQHYRVIAYSRRYHPPHVPPATNADASLERQVEDLAAIIRQLGIAPVHLVGNSYGGAVAVALALRHPDMVRTLVLAEPALGGILTDLELSNESREVRAEMQRRSRAAIASGSSERMRRASLPESSTRSHRMFERCSSKTLRRSNWTTTRAGHRSPATKPRTSRCRCWSFPAIAARWDYGGSDRHLHNA